MAPTINKSKRTVRLPASLTGLHLLALALVSTTFAPLGEVQAQQSCSATGSSLGNAIAAYSAQCNVPRRDCDPINGGWQCASYPLGENAPGGVVNQPSSQPLNQPSAPVQQPPAQPVPQPSAPPAAPVAAPIASGNSGSDSSRCAVRAPTLSAARSAYAASCTRPRVDCDPINGNWTCAAFRITGNAMFETIDVQPQATPTPTSPAPAPVQTPDSGSTYGGRYGPPRRSWMDSYSVGGRCYINTTFDHGIGDVVVSTPVGNRTVRQIAAAIGPGPGVGNNPIYNDVQCGNGPANNAGDEDANQCPGRVDQGVSGCSVRGPRWDLSVLARSSSGTENTASPQAIGNARSALPDRSRFRSGDLIGLHFDNAGDRDDGHANAADVMIVNYYGLRNSLHIVNGTQDITTPQFYVSDSEIVMSSAWGQEGNRNSWYNLIARSSNTMQKTVERWGATLAAGNKVWVAEGGTSDFTADVLKRLQANSALNLKNVHVIQHSQYNETHTRPANIATVRSLATYQRIGDGNFSGNGTTNLRQQRDDVARTLLASPAYSELWRVAFNYLPAINCGTPSQSCKFDGSDAVALLWIVGAEDLSGWEDFVARFNR